MMLLHYPWKVVVCMIDRQRVPLASSRLRICVLVMQSLNISNTVEGVVWSRLGELLHGYTNNLYNLLVV